MGDDPASSLAHTQAQLRASQRKLAEARDVAKNAKGGEEKVRARAQDGVPLGRRKRRWSSELRRITDASL